MKKVVVLAGSNSKNSINKQLATYASTKVEDAEINILDLNDFPVPIYGIDLENEAGIPENAEKLSNEIAGSDAIILSLAEHNGSYAAVFKNVFDWMSRIEAKVWRNKPMLLMASSPGGRGGAGVLGSAKMAYPHQGGNIVGEFSLPSFFDNFSDGKVSNQELNNQLSLEVAKLNDAL
ncbi:MAG: NADPH-dependent FMN reductase [Bacteroidetes bacterium MedPE-SWsnd-G1]|nr:MAG: NADPH-dependent FMN reductase [Bacteroidetes bacterium MedPE-SWsnd-G1]